LRFLPSPLAGEGGAFLVSFIDEGEGRGKKGANVLVRGRFASRDDRKREEFRLFLPLPTAGEGSAFLVGFIEEGEGEGEGKGDVATGYGVIGRPFSQRASK